jgi:MEMO1 family protein
MFINKANGVVNMNRKPKNVEWRSSPSVMFCIFVMFFGLVHTEKIFADSNQPPPAKEVVLKSSLAGKWYPTDANTLDKQIGDFFQKAKVEPIDNVIALILPHAGYQFSGQTAAMGLKTTDKKYKRVIIIGPSHYVPMEEILSVPRVTYYQTPLGLMPVDIEFVDKLLQYPMFRNVPQANEYEHSTQIQMPLLQHQLKDFRIVPIVAGTCSLETINKAADILKSLVDDDTLVIASSDFVHYGPNYDYVPFKDDVPNQIKKLDTDAYKFIAALDYKGFLDYQRKTGATICGYVPIAILLAMMPSSTQAKLINRTSSGELMGDSTNSVSYLSIAFSGTWSAAAKTPLQAGSDNLTQDDKSQLLALARKTIVYYLTKGRSPQESDLDIKISDAMKEPRAAFVTLEENNELRGCIGDIFPHQPLYKSVIANAINAAVNDWRFNPVTKQECNNLTIEISALTVPKPIKSTDQIRIGVDGVILKKNGRSAVFLPQVAPEQGWNVEQMLTQLSLKAGLPPDAWKHDADFEVFQAVVFSENKK